MARLRARLAAWDPEWPRPVGSPVAADLDPETREALRELGYGDGSVPLPSEGAGAVSE